MIEKNFVFSYWKNGILTSKFGFGDEFPFYSSTALDVIWGLLSQSYAGEQLGTADWLYTGVGCGV